MKKVAEKFVFRQETLWLYLHHSLVSITEDEA